MSEAAVRKRGLKEVLSRRTFVVFVSLKRDVAELRRGVPTRWTLPNKARPGDRVIVYKPGAGRGWVGRQEEPFEVFVAAGIVHGKPKPAARGGSRGPIGEVVWFPEPVKRALVANAFPEWAWLRQMQGSMGVEVPSTVESDFFSLIDRFAFADRHTPARSAGRAQSGKRRHDRT